MTDNVISRIATDPRALESFYRAHVEEVERFIARRVGDPHLAADLTAEVFIAAIGAAPRYDERRGAPQSWLFGVARNTVAAEHRRSARERTMLSKIQGRALLDEDDLERVQERIDASREARTLYGSIAELPRTERAILELVVLDGLRVTEAAAVLGLRPGTARVRLHRARTSIQHALAVSGWKPATTQEVQS
jgi:RNA polymerase sigma factor (sigma-70 family)